MKSNKNYRANLSELFDSIEKEILDLPDKDILERVSEAELSDISKLDAILKNKIVSFRKSQRQVARQEYLSIIQNAATKVFVFPNELKRKLEILSTVFKNNDNIPKEFTMAFREGKDLSESDIDSLLQDLAELGLLNENDIGNDK